MMMIPPSPARYKTTAGSSSNRHRKIQVIQTCLLLGVFCLLAAQTGDHHLKYEMGADEDVVVEIEAHRSIDPLPFQEVDQAVHDILNASLPTLASLTTHVDRIYYINMEHRTGKRAIMESWLSKQPIPYQRVTGQVGQNDSCVPWKQGVPCMGITGLANTNVHIMDTMNTTGLTLVLEDDFVVQDMAKLLLSVHLVPPDWDILRWDCWQKPRPHFELYPFSFETANKNDPVCQRDETEHKRPTEGCYYCGGTHAVLWKGGKSLKKLRRIWSSHPHNDIDCQLIDQSIKSYCIQVGVGEFRHPLTELKDRIGV